MAYWRLPPTAPGMRIGLYGGSFNPPHEGHLHVARTALRRLGLHQVWWLVSPQNPLKSSDETEDYAQRLAHVRALADEPGMVVSDAEAHLPSAYTAETLTALRARLAGVRLVWIMGGDNLLTFHHWRRWGDILQLMPVAVIARGALADQPTAPSLAALAPAPRAYRDARIAPQAARRLVEMEPPRWIYLPQRLHPASSTALRTGRARR